MYTIFSTADRYIESLFPQDAALNAVTDAIAASEIPDISVSAVQGRFLQVLAKLCRAHNILEIGTFLGYSTIWLGRALPPDGRLITLEQDETYAAMARKHISLAGLDSVVNVQTGAALDLLSQLQAERAGPFDMIFIDADKPPYAEYFQCALKLSRPGTLIVADNVIRHVFDVHTPAEKKAGVERFNKMMAECPDVTATIVQIVGMKEHDGMAIAIVN